MAGKGFRHRFLILAIIVIALAVAGCSSPIGSIGGRSVSTPTPQPPTAEVTGIKADPKKATYQQGESFMRSTSHLVVYARINDAVTQQTISLDSCYFFVTGPSLVENPVIGNEYPFGTPGQYKIRVRYMTFDDEYTIVVTAQTGGGNQNGSGVDGVWEPPW